MTEPLFTDDDATDAGYRNVRAAENGPMKAARQHCEELWAVFEPWEPKFPRPSQITVKGAV